MKLILLAGTAAGLGLAAADMVGGFLPIVAWCVVVPSLVALPLVAR